MRQTILLLTAVVFGAIAFGQTTGNVVGNVTDPSGATLSGATLSITNTATNLSYSTKADETGYYRFLSLRPGAYNLTAEVAGFKKKTISGIQLQLDQTARVDVSMELGEVTQSLEVTASAPVLQSETSSVGQVMSQEAVVSLPLNGRNYFDLTRLIPGIVQPTGRGSEINNKVGNGGTFAIIINGQRVENTSYLIDGIETRNIEVGSGNLLPSVDAIQEFKLQQNAFPAEFGRGTAIVNVVTKAGGNQVHGSLFEFFRNDKLDATDFFTNASGKRKDPLRRNQFGGTVGGPIQKDKTFFFATYEGLRQRRGATLLGLLPNDQWRAGNFSAPGSPRIVDPLANKTPFPNNVIPASQISQFSKATNQFYPTANLTGVAGANYARSISNANNWDQFEAKIDRVFGEKDTFTARFLSEDAQVQAFGLIPGTGQIYPTTARNVALSERHVFRPNLMNEFRAGYNFGDVVHEPPPQPADAAQLFGLRNVAGGELAGMPQTGITGFAVPSTNGFSPEGGRNHMFQLVDHFTWIKGRHTIKTGFDGRNIRYRGVAASLPRGAFTFNGQFSGNAVADFVLGDPFTARIGYGEQIFWQRWNEFSTFVQDDYKILPNLTLNIGSRWEYVQPPVSPDNHAGIFDFTQLRYFQAGTEGVPRGVTTPDKRNFAPRAGLAWSPDRKTVVRAAYGLFWIGYPQGIDTTFLHHVRPFLVRSDLTSNPNFPSLPTATSFVPPPPTEQSTNFALYPDPGARIFTFQPNVHLPYTQQWNLGIQRELAPNLVLDAGYVGSHSVRLWGRRNLNQAYLDADPAHATPLTSRRRYPNIGTCTCVIGEFPSWYDAMQAKVEKRFSQGFTLLAGYTWAKTLSIEDSTAGDFIQDSYNIYADKGLATYDVRNQFLFSGLWQLPIGKGKRFGANLSPVGDAIAGGWQVNTIVKMQTGLPVFISSPTSDNTDSLGGARPNRVCDGNLPKGNRAISRFIDTSCFTPQPFGTFGSTGRNVVLGPGMNNWDISAFKEFKVRESSRVEFRLEMFNAFNHTQFQAPGTWTANTGAFGKITSAANPREMQLGLKYLF